MSYVLHTVSFHGAHLREWLQSDGLCVLSCSVGSNCLRPHGLYLARSFCSWNFPGKNTGVGCRFPLHYISYRYLIYSLKVKYLKNISTKESDRTERLHLVNPNCSVYLNKHRTLWLLVATKGNKSKRKSPKGRGAGRRNNFYFLLHIYLIVIYKRE